MALFSRGLLSLVCSPCPPPFSFPHFLENCTPILARCAPTPIMPVTSFCLDPVFYLRGALYNEFHLKGLHFEFSDFSNPFWSGFSEVWVLFFPILSQASPSLSLCFRPISPHTSNQSERSLDDVSCLNLWNVGTKPDFKVSPMLLLG